MRVVSDNDVDDVGCARCASSLLESLHSFRERFGAGKVDNFRNANEDVSSTDSQVWRILERRGKENGARKAHLVSSGEFEFDE